MSGDSEVVQYGEGEIDRDPAIQVQIPVEGESVLLGHSESLVHSSEAVGDAEQIATTQLHDLAGQESSSVQVEFSDPDDGVMVSRPGSEEFDSEDAKVAEDAGKEDMFVDAPEELVGYDGRNIDSSSTMSRNQDNLEETNESAESRFHDDYAREDYASVDDVEGLRFMLETAVREKQVLAQENKALNTMVSELSLSREVVASYLDSLWLQSVEVTSQSQLQKEQYIEAVINRMLALFGTVIKHDELFDDSLTGKMYHVENSALLLTDNYNKFLFEIDQLKQFLTETVSDQDSRTVFVAARDELLELRRMQADLAGKLSHLEGENNLLVEQLDKHKGMTESINAEITKLKAELEQEKTRSSNTKEKLSMAVTKGKALIQQRDSLRQSVAEKTSELEKCLVELQEKSSALEAFELSKEELSKSENVVASLQEVLAQRDTILENIELMLSHTSIPEELQSMNSTEKIRWLIDETTTLSAASLEFHKVKGALSLFDMPETVNSQDLESRINWLKESIYQAKDELEKLQDSLAGTRESAHKEIDRLTASLSAEIQEKSYLQTELDDLKSKHEEISQKENQLTLDMDRIVKMFLDASGSPETNHEEVSWDSVDTLIERCMGKLKEQNIASYETRVEAESCERILVLLYIKDYELALCNNILEEEILERSKLNNLLDELRAETKELSTLKLEKNSLQTEHQRLEEKFGMVREKLSMAVKKGKGLYQDRENLKGVLDEKTEEIEKLKLELQQQQSALGEHRDQNSRLSADVECIPKLEMDIISLNEQKDQLEKFLVESNSMLQKVIESVDGIVLPTDSEFKEPVEKVKWIAGFCNESQAAKTHAEQELEKVREETSSLAANLEDATITIKSLEVALSVAENNNSRFAEEKRILESGTTDKEQELQKALEEARIHTSRSAEVSAIRNSLEDALSEAKNNISALLKDKEDATAGRAIAETELEKLKEEVSILTSKLTKAYNTVKALEDALSVAENNKSALMNELEGATAGRDAAETELQKLKEEVAIETSKLTEAYNTVKALEDALSEAENKISALMKEKEDATAGRAAAETELGKIKEEVSIQTRKLAEAYNTVKTLEDAQFLAASQVSLLSEENNNVQAGRTDLEQELKQLKNALVSQASNLEQANITIKSLEDALLMAENKCSALVQEKELDEEEILALNSKLSACMEELSGTHGTLESMSLELSGHLQNLQVLFNDQSVLQSLRKGFEKHFEKLEQIEVNLKDIRGQCVQMRPEGWQLLPIKEDSFDKEVFHDRLVSLSTTEDIYKINSADEGNILSLSRKIVDGLHSRNKSIGDNFEYISSIMDQYTTALLESFQATRDDFTVHIEQMGSLKDEVKNMEIYKHAQEDKVATLEKDVASLSSACAEATKELQFEIENSLLEPTSFYDDSSDQQMPEDGKYGETLKNLFLATRKVHNLIKQLESKTQLSVSSMKDLQNNLKETEHSLQKAIEERNLSQNRILVLETDIEELQTVCSELKLEVEEFQAKEDQLKEREAEVSSSYSKLLKKEQEEEPPLLSKSQLRTLFEKISRIEISSAGSEVEKLFGIIDNFIELQHQLKLLVHDKEELQLTLSNEVLQTEQLKVEIEKYNKTSENLGKTKSELSDLASGLEKMILKLGGSDLVGDLSSTGTNGLDVLEKFITALILDSENSKSKAQELGTKLIGSQKAVDDLSNKVKSLEESRKSRTAPSPEIVQERSIFEAPSLPSGSEISEIEDVGPLAKNVTAAQMRPLRKGSTDHLVLDIGTESDRLINNEETDEDKGHAFKSLNTSGIIPIQGKMVADRIDGIWVSGGRLLMSRPRARLGLIAYWLLIHLWLIGTIF